MTLHLRGLNDVKIRHCICVFIDLTFIYLTLKSVIFLKSGQS